MEFTYIAEDIKTGKKVNSVTTAENISVAVRNLNSRGFLPLTIKEAKNGKPLAAHFGVRGIQCSLRKKKIKSKEIMIFTRQLAATLTAGLLLSEALETVMDEMENVYFQDVISQVYHSVIGGAAFSEGLAKFPHVFPKSYISVVQTGETTGKLYLTLDSLAKFLESIEKIKQKVKSAIQYPLFVFAFSCLVVITMVVFVIPRFKEIFEQANAPLPWLTQVVINTSDFVLTYWIWIISVMFFSGGALLRIIRLPKISYLVDVLKIKLPILGTEVIHKSIISRFCRTLGFLLSSGVGLPTSLEIASQVVNHQPIQNAIREIKRKVVAGASLSSALRINPVFPKLLVKMSVVGEKTGHIDDMFNRTSDYYDSELDHSIQGLMSLLEPALIIFIGLIVGMVVIALYLPIFKMSSLVH